MRAAGGRSNARPERAAEGLGGGPVRTGCGEEALFRAGCDWGGESETGRGIARLFRYPQVLDVVAPNDEFGQLPEAVAVTRGADHIAEADVHPVVAADKVAVVGLAILELDEHRVPLRRSQERERQHHSAARRSGPRRWRRRRRVCARAFGARRGARARTKRLFFEYSSDISHFPLLSPLFLGCKGSKRGLQSERVCHRVDKLTGSHQWSRSQSPTSCIRLLVTPPVHDDVTPHAPCWQWRWLAQPNGWSRLRHHSYHRRRHWTTGRSHCAWLPWVRRSCA